MKENIFEITTKVIRKYYLKYFRSDVTHHLIHHTIQLLSKFDKGNEIKVKRNGFTWFLKPNKSVENQIYYTGVFEENSTYLVENLVKNGDIVIDIGANIGYYTLLFSKLVGSEGHVYAFEPTSIFFKKLSRHIKVNGITNTTLENTALSDDNLDKEIFVSSASASLVINDGNGFSEHIKTITLDEYVIKNNIKKIDFIKSDTDGFEINVLYGARDTLQKFKPRLLIEFCGWALAYTGKSLLDLINVLDDYGYSFFSEVTGKEYENRIELIKDYSNRGDGGSINVLCKYL